VRAWPDNLPELPGLAS